MSDPSTGPTTLQANIPVLNTPIVDQNGRLNPPWYGFFRSLLIRTGSQAGASSAALQGEIDQINAEIIVIDQDIQDIQLEAALEESDPPSLPSDAAFLAQLMGEPADSVQADPLTVFVAVTEPDAPPILDQAVLKSLMLGDLI